MKNKAFCHHITGNNNQAMSPSKKRKRVIKACEFCRKRKIKCDRASPCSGCAKYGRVCQYLEQDWETAPEDGAVMAQSDTNSVHSNASSENSLGNSSVVKVKRKVNASPPGNFGEVYDELNSLKQKLFMLEKSVERSAGKSIKASPPKHMSVDDQFHRDVISGTEMNDLLGSNPFDNIEETISFYEGYSPINLREPIRQRNFGPLTWFAMIKRDRAVRNIWEFMMFINISMQDRIRLFFRTPVESPQMERAFSEKVVNDEGFNDLKLFKDARKSTIETLISSAKKSQTVPILHIASEPDAPPTPQKAWDTGKESSDSSQEVPAKSITQSRFGALFNKNNVEDHTDFLARIVDVLPKKKVIWLLYKRFFSNFYPFMPFVDEVMLLEDLNKLMDLESFQNADDDEEVTVVKAEKRLDFAYIGVLLLILRFGYLTLTPNLSFLNQQLPDPDIYSTPEMEYMLKNPVSIEVADVSQLCLSQFNLLRSGNITIMQLALLTRYYHMYAPEDGEGTDGGDSQVFNAMLIEMAYALGMHRDPSNFKEGGGNLKVENLTRKIWYSLVISDIHSSIASGTHLTIMKNCYDTKLPYYSPGNENVLDADLERLTISSFVLYSSTLDSLRGILEVVLNLNEDVKLSVLTEKLNKFESKYLSNFAALKEDLLGTLNTSTNIEVVPKIFKLKLYFVSIFFMLGIYVFMYNHYETQRNYKLSFYYMKKVILITTQEFMPFYFELHEKNHALFRSATDLALVPEFQSTTHKCIIYLTALFLRIKFEIRNMEAKPDHAAKLITDPSYLKYHESLTILAALSLKSMGIFRTFLARLSHKYYYSWRVTKAQNYIFQVIVSSDFYEKCVKDFHANDFRLGAEESNSLVSIMERALARVQTVQFEDSRRPKLPATRPSQTVDSYNSELVNNKVQEVDGGGSFRGATGPNFAVSNDYSTDNRNVYTDEQIDKLWMNMMSSKKDISPEITRVIANENQTSYFKGGQLSNNSNSISTAHNPGVAAPGCFTSAQQPCPNSFNVGGSSTTGGISTDSPIVNPVTPGGYGNAVNINLADNPFNNIFGEDMNNTDFIGFENLLSSFNMAPDDLFRDFT